MGLFRSFYPYFKWIVFLLLVLKSSLCICWVTFLYHIYFLQIFSPCGLSYSRQWLSQSRNLGVWQFCIYIKVYDLIFVKSLSSTDFFLHVNVQFQHHLSKRLSLLPCISLAPLSKINWLFLVFYTTLKAMHCLVPIDLSSSCYFLLDCSFPFFRSHSIIIFFEWPSLSIFHFLFWAFFLR